MAKCLDEGVTVTLTVHLAERTVRGKAAMLFPMLAEQGYHQPFAFSDLREDQLLALQAEIAELRRQAKPLAAGRPSYGFRPRSVVKSE